MAVADIMNCILLDDGTALAGQPTRQQFSDLRDAGYQVIISLLPLEQDKALREEPTILEELGLEFHYIPVPWDAPSDEALAQFIAVMKGLGERATLIHCAANYRVTAFYALYGMQCLGWSEAQADALISAMWDKYPEHFQMNAVWRQFIDQGKANILR